MEVYHTRVFVMCVSTKAKAAELCVTSRYGNSPSQTHMRVIWHMCLCTKGFQVPGVSEISNFPENSRHTGMLCWDSREKIWILESDLGSNPGTTLYGWAWATFLSLSLPMCKVEITPTSLIFCGDWLAAWLVPSMTLGTWSHSINDSCHRGEVHREQEWSVVLAEAWLGGDTSGGRGGWQWAPWSH